MGTLKYFELTLISVNELDAKPMNLYPNSRQSRSSFTKMLPKIPKWDIFGPKFKNFYFCAKPWNLKNWRVLILNIAILFSNSSLNVPNKKYFDPKLISFGFTWIFLLWQIQECLLQIWQ